VPHVACEELLGQGECPSLLRLRGDSEAHRPTLQGLDRIAPGHGQGAPEVTLDKVGHPLRDGERREDPLRLLRDVVDHALHGLEPIQALYDLRLVDQERLHLAQ
jgi:hypothetical protein